MFHYCVLIVSGVCNGLIYKYTGELDSLLDYKSSEFENRMKPMHCIPQPL